MTDQGGAYAPVEMAGLIAKSGVAKAHLPLGQMGVLALLAGAFIGFGAAGYLMAMTGAPAPGAAGYGAARILGGLVFSLGLILVVVGGAELFTGNALMVMGLVEGQIPPALLVRNWAVVYAGNAVGAGGLALAFWAGGLLTGPLGETAAALAAAKAAAAPLPLLVKGALCNALVCLAVWLAMSARDTGGKILAILWPVTTFVALGLEHSIANLFFLPLGALAGGAVPLGGALQNLALVTLGNVLGGAGGVALAYRYAYLGPRR